MSQMQEITIPPLPVVVMQVIRFDPASDTADSRTLENIIAPDKGVCADVLRVANSAFYGRSGRVKAMRDAIGLLGLKAVKNLVIFLSTKSLTAPLRGEVFRKHLVEYPIVAALIAENLATQTKLANPEEAFLCGLLHKIGMTVLALDKKNVYGHLIEESERNGEDILPRETKAFGMNHIDVGRKVFQAWNLPDQLQKVLYQSDDPEIPHVRLTFLAGHITRRLIGLKPTPGEIEMLDKVIPRLPDSSILYDYDEGYFVRLKQHPYYIQAVGAA